MPLAGDLVRASDLPDDGAWTAFTLTTGGSSNFTVGNATQSCAYMHITDKTVAFRIKIVLGSTSAVSGQIALGPLPFTSAEDQTVPVRLADASGADYGATGLCISGSTQAGTFNFDAGVATSTAPFTWATGDVIYVTGVIEIA